MALLGAGYRYHELDELSTEQAYMIYKAIRYRQFEDQRDALLTARFHAFMIGRMLGIKAKRPIDMGRFAFEPKEVRRRDPEKERKRKEFSERVRAWARKQGYLKDDGQDIS